MQTRALLLRALASTRRTSPSSLSANVKGTICVSQRLFATRSGRNQAEAAVKSCQQQARRLTRKEPRINQGHEQSTPNWKQALADFERLGASPGPFSATLDASSVHDIVELCVKNDRPREALEVTKRARQLGVGVSLASHALVCSAIAKKGNFDRALEMIEEFRTKNPTEFSTSVYDPLLSVLKTQSDWRSTHRVIQQMHQFKLDPPLRAFRILMLSAAKARKKDTLFATIDFVQRQFPDAKTDVATLTAICQALVAVEETKRVLSIYNEMDTKWLQEHANTILYNNVLLAAVKTDQHMDRAMAIVDQMKESVNGHPDDFTFATCMLEFEKREDWTQVLSLYNEMQERDIRKSADASSQKPVINALTCAAVIRALHKVQENPEATSRNSKSLKRDLQVVLSKLSLVDLSNLGHASNLVDTLDEFRLYTHARQVFARLLADGVIHEDAWIRKDGYEIDLHTFSYGVAKCAVVHAFEAIKRRHEHHIRTSNDQADDDLRIITGVGKHSKEYLKPKIRDEVTLMFSRSFRPPIWPATHPINPGVLIVRRKVLRNWILKDGVVRCHSFRNLPGHQQVRTHPSTPSIPMASAPSPILLFAHGGGLCKEAWGPIIRRLQDSPLLHRTPTAVSSFDYPYHGSKRDDSIAPRLFFVGPKSPRVVHPVNAWVSINAQETYNVVQQLRQEQKREGGEKRPLIGIGHSMGAISLWLTEINYPGTFDGLILFEPMYGLSAPETEPLVDFLAGMTLRREGKWPSREAALKHFAGFKNLAAWDREALASYLEGGLIEEEDGSISLACQPLVEAAIYCGNAGWFSPEETTRPKCKISFQGGERSPFYAVDEFEVMRERSPHIYKVGVPMPKCSHAMVMENPELSVQKILEDLSLLPAYAVNADSRL
ncbi:Ppr repeat protein, partial [Globisporangium splendens]